MKRDYYELPESSKIMRFLWKAAGGDRYILERATYSDQIKYMCLGGIVFATGAMAGLAGGYAFYTIFSPKGSALENELDYTTMISSIVFGIIWGLIIFNIDRFIVTSTGKGDGTEKITWDEFKSAIPRIIMGAIIAITISKPIEIRMFQTEINNKLYEKQLILQKEFEKRTTANFEERLKVVENELGDVGKQKQDLIERIKVAEQAYTDNLMGKANGIVAGDGPLSKALKSQIDNLNKELDRFNEMNKTKIETADKKRKEILEEKEKALATNVQVAKGLDGLLERIKLAHEVAGFWITLFITLLFMAIELTPIFFKLMLNKTPYDYLSENRDDLIRAENGIEVRYDYYKDKKGIERHLIINHEAEKIIFEKMKVTEIQKELTEYAIAKYKEKEKEKIDANLDEYIKKINPDEFNA
ncbi:DUF4407 domain-containing protein [Flavobacterium ammonificans]|uniref:DUF4407 domain-containing protein n=1 Tax=Flavobacterium ammonificans TaxID=1751056 RepID=A0ABM7V1M3_9FLAO|nr:DUF4407 domain-containing protein [Flavobacterium ammonificans]BDB53081.1 hypothetical protein GENT11_13930 [Flavobacterium ammonificans]